MSLLTPYQIGKAIDINTGRFAALLGNGINLCGSQNSGQSWTELLKDLWHQQVNDTNEDFPSTEKEDLSATEIYDLISLRRKPEKGKPSYELAQQIANKMAGWKPTKFHKNIVEGLARCNIPVLTTNFDELLAKALSLQFLKRPHGKTGFTDIYPWECCFTNKKEIQDPANEFAVWHIHGTVRYPRSIRLGLSDYMGLIQRARGNLYRGENALFKAKNQKQWKGNQTWLHIWFHCDLFILGLGLTRDEIFLRWMLIEREKYFRRFPDRRRTTWYIYKHEKSHSSKPSNWRFLEGIGVSMVAVKGQWEEIYEGMAQSLI